MKKIKYRYHLHLLAIMAVIVITSCEKIIDISIPDKERKIVVNGLIRSNQPVMVNLSRSLSVLEKDSLISITGGDVNLYHGSDLVGKFREESGGFYYLPGFIPKTGQTYRLTASYNGLNKVEAEATLPPLVPILSVDTATLTGEWGQKELRLKIKFDDPAGERNIYGFGVDVTYKEFDYNTMTYTGKKISNPAYLSGNSDQFLKEESLDFEGKIYLEDLLFDGMGKTIEFGLSDYSFYQSDTVWLDVKMEQVDLSYYYYVLSFSSYQQAHGNPFSEPVQVYSNVKGGYGIFSGSSVSSYQIIASGMWKFH
jgi:hypothetical protein